MEKKKEVTEKEKMLALVKAVKIWNSGEYQRAMSLCKKYGVSDREFAQGLVYFMRKGR